MSANHIIPINNPDTIRTCRHCGNPLKGRADKKFCTSVCRNAHNNRLHMEKRTRVRAHSFPLTSIAAGDYWKKKYFELLERYWVLKQYWESISKGSKVH